MEGGHYFHTVYNNDIDAFQQQVTQALTASSMHPRLLVKAATRLLRDHHIVHTVKNVVDEIRQRKKKVTLLG